MSKSWPTTDRDASVEIADLNMTAPEMAREIRRLRSQLARANTLIGWMMPYIGRMCPPPDGLYDLNIHCCENKVPDPGDVVKGRPVGQRYNHVIDGRN